MKLDLSPIKPMVTSRILPLDEDLAQSIRRKLYEHYPGWAWTVEIPPNQGVVIIRNLDADPRGRYGYLVKLARVYCDPDLKSVMRAGGEFLERYRLRRAAYKPELVEGRKMFVARPDS